MIAHIKCFKCNKMGHYSDCCPEAVEGDQMHVDAFEILMPGDDNSESNGEDKEEVTMLPDGNNKDDDATN